MKYLLKSSILCVAVLGLAACETPLAGFDDAVPYTLERTAPHEQTMAPAPQPAAAPAPLMTEAPSCSCDCSSWEDRALHAEKDLAICTEATSRVRDAYRDELKK